MYCSGCGKQLPNGSIFCSGCGKRLFNGNASQNVDLGENKPGIVVNAVSPAEEVKKMKELLDTGIITQEEFDAKKKELLGL